MSLRRAMQETGPEMVRGAAKEISGTRSGSPLSVNSKALSPETVKSIMDSIKENGKVTTSVPLSKILLEDNVRTHLSDASIKELGESLLDVGLIHNITLHLIERDGCFYFTCVSGKRRSLAALAIGWEKIDAEIRLSDDPIESLYVGAIANLHEAVFWLDNAILYENLHRMGHSDSQISTRVKVNERTVGWFRRLAKMSETCQNLARAHAELFNSRWAQQVARHGDLPRADILEDHMLKMISQKRTWHQVGEPLVDRAGATTLRRSDAVVSAHKIVESLPKEVAVRTQSVLQSLTEAGFISRAALRRIEGEFFKTLAVSHEVEEEN